MLFPFGVTATELSYFHDSSGKLREAELRKQQFLPLEKTLNFGGQNQGVYWIRAEGFTEDKTLEFPSIHLNQIEVSGAFAYERLRTYPSFDLKAGKVYYFKIKCEKEAFIPFRVMPKDQFDRFDSNRFFINGLYYGFALMVILLNLFLFFRLEDRSFLFYAFFLFSMAAIIFLNDGFFYFLGFSGNYVGIIEAFIHCLLPLAACLFVYSFLAFEETYPWFWTVFLPAIFLVIGLLGYYLIRNNFGFFRAADSVAEIILISLWVLIVLQSRENPAARLIALAYAPVLFLAMNLYISPLYGWPVVRIDTNLVKAGSLLEMIAITFIIVKQMDQLRQENHQMKNDLFTFTSKMANLQEELQSVKNGSLNSLSNDLNRREVEVLELISQGLQNKEIAEKLFISVNTVKYHTKKLYAKLNIKNRSEIPLKLD